MAVLPDDAYNVGTGDPDQRGQSYYSTETYGGYPNEPKEFFELGRDTEQGLFVRVELPGEPGEHGIIDSRVYDITAQEAHYETRTFYPSSGVKKLGETILGLIGQAADASPGYRSLLKDAVKRAGNDWAEVNEPEVSAQPTPMSEADIEELIGVIRAKRQQLSRPAEQTN